MKKYLVAVRDTKAEFFNDVMTFSALGQAERAFTDEANKPDSMMFKHPEDFGLYLIGTYESSTGIITPEIQPKHLCNAINVTMHQKQ